MPDQVTFTYKPQHNGPLEPRVHHIQVMMAKVDLMIEDRDAKADLSTEPDLLDFPEWTAAFFGANLAAREIVEDEEGDDTACGDYGDDNWDLSPEEWAELDELNCKHNTEFYRPEDLMTLRRLYGLRWVQET